MEIEIFKQSPVGDKISLGILKVNQVENYEIPKNTAVLFQNQSKSQTARIKIEFRGTSNLTMGYKEN